MRIGSQFCVACNFKKQNKLCIYFQSYTKKIYINVEQSAITILNIVRHKL